jgi:hypothetical protein
MQEPIRMMLHTIQHLKHNVCTAFGKSDSCFEASKVHPVAIQGIGQGNGAGLWKQQMGGHFLSPITENNYT